MRRVWQNNMYMLRIIHSTDPWLIPLRLGMSTLVSVTYFLGSTYLLQYVLNAVDEGKGFLMFCGWRYCLLHLSFVPI